MVSDRIAMPKGWLAIKVESRKQLISEKVRSNTRIIVSQWNFRIYHVDCHMWGHFQTPETSQRVDNNRKKGAMYRKSKKNSTSQINILGKKSKRVNAIRVKNICKK